MRRIAPLLLLLIISLCGCAVKDSSPLECISDTLNSSNAPSFYIAANIPAQAVLTDSCNDGCCAIFSHEDYEIYQEIFPASNLNEALFHLTGRTDLPLIQTNDFPMEEYRLTYLAAGEGGTQAFYGKLIFDGTHCYSLIAHCPAEKQAEYEEVFSDLLALSTLQAI